MTPGDRRGRVPSRGDRGSSPSVARRRGRRVLSCLCWITPAIPRRSSRRGISYPIEMIQLSADAVVLTNPSGRRVVVGAVDFNAAVEMHDALAVRVEAKRLDGQRQQVRLLLGKHRCDLPLRRAMDPRVGPSRIPFVEVALCVLDAFEAQPLERRALRVADAGLDLALSVRIPDTTRQRDDAVVTENVAVQRIELRVVDVRLEYALAQIVEHDGRRRAAQRRNACSWSSAQIRTLDAHTRS